MKTILGYISFLLLLPWLWFILWTKEKQCKVCLGLKIHECLMCGEMIGKKECKYQDGMCRNCVSDCCDVV
jgi:hypothetical protein